MRLGSVTARQSSSGRQGNFAALNRGRHLNSAGRPSRWALAHIVVAVVSVCSGSEDDESDETDAEDETTEIHRPRESTDDNDPDHHNVDDDDKLETSGASAEPKDSRKASS